MYTIAKRFSFSASHAIGGLAHDHPCGRLHGHNYEVEVVLEADALGAVGFVRDFRELRALKAFLDEHVDHKHLNDVIGHDRTTSERWNDTLATPLEDEPIEIGKKYLAKRGWSPGKHGR